jgi:hypothetical protein
MATNKFRVPFKKAVIVSTPPASGAGSASMDPVRVNGYNGVNLWGTGAGQGVPAGYAMLALDGVIVATVTVTSATTEGKPIYITSANALTDVATSNTLFGYSDDKNAATTGTQTIGVRISNAV